jgi:hypothetical protein
MQRRPRHHILADFLQLSRVHVSLLRVISFVILPKSLPPREDLALYLYAGVSHPRFSRAELIGSLQSEK